MNKNIGAPGSFARLCSEHPELVREIDDYAGIRGCGRGHSLIAQYCENTGASFTALECGTLLQFGNLGDRTKGQQSVFDYLVGGSE